MARNKNKIKMKKTVIIVIIFLTALSTQAQENKREKVILEVDGVCKMCKKRIEKASYKTKGVKYAKWNVDTHQLMLIIDETKTSVEKIQKNIADAGHDNVFLGKEKIIASDEKYNSIHKCCRYRDVEIIKNHQ